MRFALRMQAALDGDLEHKESIAAERIARKKAKQVQRSGNYIPQDGH